LTEIKSHLSLARARAALLMHIKGTLDRRQ